VWIDLALCERDPRAAGRALVALGQNTFGQEAVRLRKNFGQGLVARMIGDEAGAHAAFAAAREEQIKAVEAQPEYGPALCILGLIDAGLGRKEEALREGRRAIELLPPEKDPINGRLMLTYSAIIAAWCGEKDLAMQRLNLAMPLPNKLHYGQLKLHPFWDPLRGDPRFEKIVISLAPKEDL
jgi:tetratricopeptide (TPR) repeat protein